MPALDLIHQLSSSQAFDGFMKCCGSTTWAKLMVEKRPFESKEKMFQLSDEIWFGLTKIDWMEAFSHHARIGENAHKHAEQKGVLGSDQITMNELQKQNQAYEKKFGFLFLICATGKSGAEMLAALNARIQNTPEQELSNAVTEQSKITKLRLQKWIES